MFTILSFTRSYLITLDIRTSSNWTHERINQLSMEFSFSQHIISPAWYFYTDNLRSCNYYFIQVIMIVQLCPANHTSEHICSVSVLVTGWQLHIGHSFMLLVKQNIPVPFFSITSVWHNLIVQTWITWPLWAVTSSVSCPGGVAAGNWS